MAGKTMIGIVSIRCLSRHRIYEKNYVSGLRYSISPNMKRIVNILTLVVSICAIIWFIVSPSFEAGITAIISLITTIGSFFSNIKAEADKKDITLSLKLSDREVKKYWNYLKYSFFRNELIHPKIIEDLQESHAVTGEQVVAVNLSDSQDSNRYFGEIKIRSIENSKYPYVYYENGKASFGYYYIGTSSSGIHVLQTSECGGGSGIFMNLMFLVLETDESIKYDYDQDILDKRRRVNLKTIGLLALGGRYDGQITLNDGILKIGKDVGRLADNDESKDKYIKLE
jgi:hypothetical protein